MSETRDDRTTDHPVRERIRGTLRQSDRPLSAGELAELFEMPCSRIAYHLLVLRQAGKVLVARSESVGSSLIRFYELAPPDFSRNGPSATATG